MISHYIFIFLNQQLVGMFFFKFSQFMQNPDSSDVINFTITKHQIIVINKDIKNII